MSTCLSTMWKMMRHIFSNSQLFSGSGDSISGFKQNIDTYMSECPADSIECFKKQLDKCLLRPMRTAFQLSFISEDGKSKPVEMYMVSIPDLDKRYVW